MTQPAQMNNDAIRGLIVHPAATIVATSLLYEYDAKSLALYPNNYKFEYQ